MEKSIVEIITHDGLADYELLKGMKSLDYDGESIKTTAKDFNSYNTTHDNVFTKHKDEWSYNEIFYEEDEIKSVVPFIFFPGIHYLYGTWTVAGNTIIDLKTQEEIEPDKYYGPDFYMAVEVLKQRGYFEDLREDLKKWLQ
jgi:hypothetical protein